MLATLASDTDQTTEHRQARRPRTPAVRVLPVPRSEPLTDDERRAAGLDAPPMAAQLLPLDLPTGAQVRRGPRWRGTGGADGSVDAPDAEPAGATLSGSGACGGKRVALAGDGAQAGDEAAEAGPAARVAGQAGIAPLRPLGDLASTGGPGSFTPPGLSIDRMAAEDESADAIELRQATRRLLATCLEVVGGYRPVVQLRPFCQAERFDSIVNRLLRPATGAGRGHGATRASVVAGHGGPPRAGRAARTGPGDRVTVRRVQICDVSGGVAEIAVVMARRDKVWAMAIRMELARGRWQCTHLEVL